MLTNVRTMVVAPDPGQVLCTRARFDREKIVNDICLPSFSDMLANGFILNHDAFAQACPSCHMSYFTIV